MTTYRCKLCNTEQDGATMSRGETRACAESGCPGILTNKCRVFNDDARYANVSFASRKKVKVVRTAIANRSQAAPPPPGLTNWPQTPMPAGLTYVDDIAGDAAWNNPAATDIRLPFSNLDISKNYVQGLIIDFARANASTRVRAHFDNATAAMLAAVKAQDVTEAVGEIAACMFMLEHNPYANTYMMRWGFDAHAGAGIDQIWWNGNAGSPEYVIVEAKGPNQDLSSSIFDPPNCGQMQRGWVADRLSRMATGGSTGAALAQEIIRNLKLEIFQPPQLANYGGASKSYKDLRTASSGTRIATISGITIQAKWKPSGMLGYKRLYAHTWAL